MRKYVYATLLGVAALFLSCAEKRHSHGYASGSSAEYEVGSGRYGVELFYEYKMDRTGRNADSYGRMIGPVAVLRSDLKQHRYWGAARNGGIWEMNKTCVTKTGDLQPDSIYYIEKDKSPVFLAKIPVDFEVKINSEWSTRGVGALLVAKLLGNEGDSLRESIIQKLLDLQKSAVPES